jgi:hypothetical protein
MIRERTQARRWIRVGFTVGMLAVLIVLPAAPALADPAATSWTVSPTSKTVTYGQGVFLSGELKSGGTAIPALWVDFGQGTTQAGSFEIVYKITTPLAAQSARYSVGVMPLETTYYRFQWAGDATYAAGDSDVIPVQVAPALGAPGNGTSITAGKKFSVKGSVQPGAPHGPAIKLKAYRRKGDGSWAGYKTYATKISGTEYSQSVTIASAGKYRFRVVSVASEKYAAGQSGYGRVLTVKK